MTGIASPCASKSVAPGAPSASAGLERMAMPVEVVCETRRRCPSTRPFTTRLTGPLSQRVPGTPPFAQENER
jgi:hypothetical protein